MRMLYSLTRGKSNKILSYPFKLKYKYDKSISTHKSDLNTYGYVNISPSEISSSLVTVIKNKCKKLSVYNSAKYNQKKLIYSSFDKLKATNNFLYPRYIHFDYEVAAIPEVWQLIEHSKLIEIASSYLGCQPLITNISSWYVTPLVNAINSEDLYSYSAQSYHYDVDWLSFLKVFINLDDVDSFNGPFEFLPYTHRGRSSKYYKDQRYTELDKSAQPVFSKGPQGSIFIADTSGLHRDGRAISSTRQVLTIEFANSTFGGKYKIDENLSKLKETAPNLASVIPSSFYDSRASKLLI
tara:strand:+ start:364 stop:1251 length:888 start_codon:yes stop_codon:yes gene_type:complete